MRVRTVEVRASGHPVLRGTHAKTFEFTTEAEVGSRATCVLGVSARFPDELALLRGEVTLTVRAGGHSASGAAVINPSHAVGDRLIIRRSDSADADTLAVRSSLTAADLPEAMIEALASPDVEVELTITERSAPPPLIIFGPGPGTGRGPGRGRLGALVAAAEPINPAQPPRDWAGRIFYGRTEIATAPGATAARNWLAVAAAEHARFVVDGDPVTPLAALLAAGLPAAPHVWLGRLVHGGLRDRAIRAAFLESPAPVAAIVTHADAAEALNALASADPHRRVAVPDGRLDIGVGMQWRSAGAALTNPWPGDGPLVVAPVAEAGSVNVAALLLALRGAGVPARTVADALGPLGWDRRTLYRLLGSGRENAQQENLGQENSGQEQ